MLESDAFLSWTVFMTLSTAFTLCSRISSRWHIISFSFLSIANLSYAKMSPILCFTSLLSVKNLSLSCPTYMSVYFKSPCFCFIFCRTPYNWYIFDFQEIRKKIPSIWLLDRIFWWSGLRGFCGSRGLRIQGKYNLLSSQNRNMKLAPLGVKNKTQLHFG